jgi:hypothetical protein
MPRREIGCVLPFSDGEECMLGSLLKEMLGRSRQRGDAPAESPFDDLDVPDRTLAIADLARKLIPEYLDYPRFVHLETLALCNAACEFCPYPSSERKGTKMSDALIAKVIDDLTAIPPELKFQLALYKLSEPFLEPRLFDIMALAAARLPGARFSLITNGSALIERQIDKLARAQRVQYLTVSLNFDNAEEYEKVMKIPFARTVSRLDALHRRKVRGDLGFPVRVTRVACDRESDRDFLHWVKATWPAFDAWIVARNDWIGDVPAEGLEVVPDAPCRRWFDLSVTATGKVALCCMDGDAKYPTGDVNVQHALEVYNQPWRRELRRTLVSRRTAADPCNRCTYT